MDFSIKSFITNLDNISVCTPDEEIGQVLNLLQSSHDAVFVFDEKNNLVGLINPYQELFKKRHPFTTKVQSVALIPQHLTLDSSIFDICKFMLESRIYRVPVFKDQNKEKMKVIGKVEVKDLLKGVLKNKQLSEDISNFLKPKKVVTLHKNVYVKDVYNLLREKHISRVVLTDDEGQVLGIVSRYDIQKAFIAPTSRQRFHKNSGDSGQLMFDTEKITRRDEPVTKYQTRMVSTISHQKSLKEAVMEIVKSDLDDIVIINKASQPVGILTTRDILQAILKYQPEKLPNIIFEKPKDVSQGDIEMVYEYLLKFVKKLNKRSLIHKVEISFKEVKFLTGKIAIFDVTLIISFYNGKSYVSKTKKKQLLIGIKELIKELEKQFRRDKEQINHHQKPHHNLI